MDGCSNLQNKNFAPFRHLNFFLVENELDVNECVFKLMKQHISILGEEIWQYFSELEDFQNYCRFVNNSFGRHGMEWNGNFGMEYGKYQNGMERKISKMKWTTIFHTSIPIPY